MGGSAGFRRPVSAVDKCNELSVLRLPQADAHNSGSYYVPKQKSVLMGTSGNHRTLLNTGVDEIDVPVQNALIAAKQLSSGAKLFQGALAKGHGCIRNVMLVWGRWTRSPGLHSFQAWCHRNVYPTRANPEQKLPDRLFAKFGAHHLHEPSRPSRSCRS